MKKNIKSLIALLIVLAVFVGIFFAAKMIAKNEESNASDTEAVTVTVFDYTDNTITSVAYDDNGSVVKIVLSGSVYKLSEDENFPLNQSVAEYMITAATTVNASGSTNGAGMLEEYGLDEPEKSIEVTLSNGAVTKLWIGDYNKYSSVYYGKLEGDNTVYYLEEDIVDYFGLSLDDLLKDEAVTAPEDGISEVDKITVEAKDGSSYYLEFVAGVAEETSEDGTVITEGTDDTWKKYDTQGNLLSEDATSEADDIYNIVCDTELEDWVDYYCVGDENLARYGLSEPSYKITVAYTETVTASASDETSTVSTEVKKEIVFLVGDRLPYEDEEDADETEDTEEVTSEVTEEETTEVTTAEVTTAEETTAEATEETTAEETTEETAVDSETEAETETEDTEEEETESSPYSRYVMIDGGKIVYVLSEDTLAELLN